MVKSWTVTLTILIHQQIGHNFQVISVFTSPDVSSKNFKDIYTTWLINHKLFCIKFIYWDILNLWPWVNELYEFGSVCLSVCRFICFPRIGWLQNIVQHFAYYKIKPNFSKVKKCNNSKKVNQYSWHEFRNCLYNFLQ